MMKIMLEKCSENHAQWLALKKGRVGSSQIATICGMNPFQTSLELWAEMTEKVPPKSDNDAMWFGREAEPIIGKLYQRRNPDVEVVKADVLIQHPVHDWAIASPDFWTLRDSVRRILEAKNASYKQRPYWANGAPEHYLMQLNWQLGVCAVDQGHIAGLIGASLDEFVVDEFDRSGPLFEHCLNMAGEFLENVRKDVPPVAGAGDARLVAQLQGERSGTTIPLGPEVVETVDAFELAQFKRKDLNRQLRELDDDYDKWKARLLQLLGNASRGTLSDGRTVSATKVVQPPKTIGACSYVNVSVRTPLMKF